MFIKHAWGTEKNHKNVIKRRDRVVNTPASYSGGPGLKSQSGDRLT
jgi:hypothetical protein